MVQSRRLGAVASGHPLVSEAAATLLRAGGNAFDAAVAAGFASSVAEPAFTSLGGGGFLLAVTPEREVLFDFFTETPGRGARCEKPHFQPVNVRFPGTTQVFHVGLGSIAVPGSLLGLVEVHKQLGRAPLEDVLAPAIAIARDGVVLTSFVCDVLRLLWPIYSLTEGSRAVFAQDGDVPAAGCRLDFGEMAGFLADLPRGGVESFYRGELAERIADDLAQGGGMLTRADLAAYRVEMREPLAVDYRGLRVLLNPAPAGGGIAVGRLLRMFGALDPSSFAFGDGQHLARLALTMREGERLRGAPLDDDDAHASAAESVRSFSRGTTHLTVADANGNVASMTTSNGEGSGYVAPGTGGIMLNNMMGEDDLHPRGWHQDPPGQRISSMMCPTVVIGANGPRLALGTGGSKRIRTAIFQVLTHVLDLGLPLADAIRAPRVHWDGEAVQAEPGYDDDAYEVLARALPVNRWQARDMYFGGVHAVEPFGDAAADARREGHALIVHS